MDQAVLPTRGGANDDQPNFTKSGDILPSQAEGPRSTCSIFEDPLAASASSSTSFEDPADDLMKAYVRQRERSPHLDEIVQKDGPRPDPGVDASECSESKMASSLEPIDAVMTEIDRAVKMECMQWTQVFMESDQFEVLSSDHVDKLLEDARALEENLLEKKERLLSHLKLLSQTLKLP
ncbi:uncharacterized protein LOC115925878 [Strongylocentrotus purpuratus]|uniref:Uncharacterized protein n=1 Tax=Strongylocentrotus purpuratus TaxID=7668 RepID=A0A7M7T0Z0_STRPU|nr:uncharacterized protein LOC115925878 [Strongylocentrotus purpuratus]